MNKKTLLIALIVVVVILILAGEGYYYWKIKPQQTANDLQKTKASITAEIGNSVSPDVTTPNANPYNTTNPFSNLKTNPFK